MGETREERKGRCGKVKAKGGFAGLGSGGVKRSGKENEGKQRYARMELSCVCKNVGLIAASQSGWQLVYHKSSHLNASEQS